MACKEELCIKNNPFALGRVEEPTDWDPERSKLAASI
jgi:fibrillarin-like rRNA methylase